MSEIEGSFSDDRNTRLFNRSEDMGVPYDSNPTCENNFRNLNSDQSKSPTISDSEIELADSLLEGHDATGAIPAHSLDSFDVPSSGHGAHVTLKGTTYTAFFELKEIDLTKLTETRTFKYPHSWILNNHGIRFEIPLDILQMAGSVSCEIFSNGRVKLNSVKTQADEEVEKVVKPILEHIAGSIQEAHLRSISHYGVCVILSDLPNDIRPPDDSLCMFHQLDSSVPFKIKYTRLDQAYKGGKFNSVAYLEPLFSELKENGHGYEIKWPGFSATIYHSGKIAARTKTGEKVKKRKD